MIAATATFAVLATEASAQHTPVCQSGAGTCSSDQTQSGEVTGTVNLDVGVDQLTVTNTAVGNDLRGGIEDASGALRSTQAMTGAARADTLLTVDGEIAVAIGSTTQARANYLQATTDGATFELDAAQDARGEEVTARTQVVAPTSHILGGGSLTSAAVANGVLMGGPSSSVTGRIDQASQTTVFADAVANIQYAPAPAALSSQALANQVQVMTTGASHQDLVVRQSNAPSTVEAQTDIYIDNAWDLAGRANAGANQVVLNNAGGSLVAATDQANAGRVRAATRVQTNLQGQTTAQARAAANEVVAGNNDIYLELDNTQLNTGGVEATAAYVGVNGYDAYVGADAVGNSVTGYACSQCGGEINIVNSQTNNGDVTAAATATVGAGRSAVIGANATGNSATFYISRPGS